MTKQIITAETVRLAWKAGESVIVYAKGDIVTQQAQDDARHYGITLTTETPVAPSSALAEPEAEAVPPVPPVLEEVPASQEPVHVPTPALTADQLAAAARQLQEALVPLTQALTASVAPAAQPVPPSLPRWALARLPRRVPASGRLEASPTSTAKRSTGEAPGRRAAWPSWTCFPPPKGMPPPWAIWIGKTSRFPGRSGVRKCSSCWKAT